MPHLNLQVSPGNDIHRKIILESNAQFELQLPREVALAISDLWLDPNVKEAIRLSRKFQLNDSAVYYFSAIDRICKPDYCPTDQDILYSRVRTTGISETVFKVGPLTYKIFDVGGTRSERRKWIHCFENAAAVLFVVGLSEYDQMLHEDESVVECPFSLLPICHPNWLAL